MGNGANVVSDNFVSTEPVKPVAENSDLITKKLTHGCNLLIQNNDARKAFVEYLKSGIWIDQLVAENASNKTNSPLLDVFEGYTTQKKLEQEKEKQQQLDKTTDGQVDSLPNNQLDDANDMFHDYILPAGKKEFLANSVFGSSNTQRPITPPSIESIIETCFTISQMKSVLLATVFPLFLQSDEYERLVLTEVESYDGGEKPSAKKSVKGALEHSAREERLDELFQPRERRLKDIISQALNTVDTEELGRMLISGDWLQNLIATVEDLPLCVSLATARPDRRGFPLVYVNKAFENTTQYDRKDIIGHNCRFLQSDKSEPEQIQKMSYALKYAQPVKVALTNVRKDGTEFYNLLAMKPVFDSEGVYSYVIGVQYDISNQEASLKEIKLVNDLLSILPNVLK